MISAKPLYPLAAGLRVSSRLEGNRRLGGDVSSLGKLRPKDSDALVLRYVENKTLQEVGAALGLRERAAQKRVARGLERLRGFFLKRGVLLSAGAIAGAV